MKWLLCAVALLLMAMAYAQPVSAEETYISVNGGMFFPGSGYPDDYDPGFSAGLSYIMVNEYAGFEFGLNGYTATSELYEEDVTGMGLELLVHFHKTDSTFQPFIAFGVGRYRTIFESPFLEETINGGGSVLKVGARLFLGRSVFIGAYYKRFNNDTVFPYSVGPSGGDTISAEIGVVSF